MISLSAYLALGLPAAQPAASQQAPFWPVGHDLGTTPELITDFGLTDDDIKNSSRSGLVDFVWGTTHLEAWRASANPDVVLSHYIPFNRDLNMTRNLDWYLKHHPDFLARRCDKSVAFSFNQTYYMPIDFSNEAALEFMAEQFIGPAAAAGYDAIAFDNTFLHNFYGICGAYRDGKWVQLYDGTVDDPAYVSAMVVYMQKMAAIVHRYKSRKGVPMLMIPNFSLHGAIVPAGLPPAPPGTKFKSWAWDDPAILATSNATDGLLSESGWINFGQGLASGWQWEQIYNHALNCQAHGKAIYFINEWPKPIPESVRSYVIASTLLVRGGPKASRTGVYIAGIATYATWNWYPEYDALPKLGAPKGPASKISASLYRRDFDGGVALVNPSATDSSTLQLDDAVKWTTLFGFPAASTVVLPPMGSSILFSAPAH